MHVMCIYLNAQSRWPLRIWHCQCIMSRLKEIDKEKVHFTIDLAPGLFTESIACTRTKHVFRFTREYV